MEQVYIKMARAEMLDEGGVPNGQTECMLLAFGASSDWFDYISPIETSTMTADSAYDRLPANLQDEIDDNGGVIYLGSFVATPLGTNN